MKKNIVVLLMILCGGTFVQAQVISETVRITLDQVPLSIRKAYEREIGTIPEDGSWAVRVTLERGLTRAIPTPTAYMYTNRKNKEKVDVRFTTEGEITYAKGVARNPFAEPTTAPGSSGKEKN